VDVDQVASAVSAREGIYDAIEDLVETLDQANTSFDHRHEAILRAENY
jgi:hypothetical protein